MSFQTHALLFFLLLLLMGSCSVFYPVILSSCNVDVQLSHQRFGDRPDSPRCLVSIFCDFCQPIIMHSVYVISSCSSTDSGFILGGILNLADVFSFPLFRDEFNYCYLSIYVIILSARVQDKPTVYRVKMKKGFLVVTTSQPSYCPFSGILS